MARPILNRRQLLGAILATGAAGGVGLATAGPAFAGPPADWRLLPEGLSESSVTTDGVVNHQALVGAWTDGSAITLDRVYRGVRLHNTSRRTTTVQYQHRRSSWRAWTHSPVEPVVDEVRTWVLRPDERKVVWFGGWENPNPLHLYRSEGRTQYGNRAWGSWSDGLLLR